MAPRDARAPHRGQSPNRRHPSSPFRRVVRQVLSATRQKSDDGGQSALQGRAAAAALAFPQTVQRRYQLA